MGLVRDCGRYGQPTELIVLFGHSPLYVACVYILLGRGYGKSGAGSRSRFYEVTAFCALGSGLDYFLVLLS